jgi:ATP-dependent exoDNAse (exonuclease V) alpha subunit
MIQELDSIILTTDLPEYGLKQGDIGTVVLTHRGGEGYEVEFVTLDGETVAVVSLHAPQVRPIGHGEIAHARTVASMQRQA